MYNIRTMYFIYYFSEYICRIILVLNVLGLHVNCIDLKFENDLLSRYGVGWPSSLHVAAGNEALMRLNVDGGNLTSCKVTTPSGVMFDVESPPAHDYQKWSDGCGVRVKRVKTEHEGRWRLTATRDDGEVTGWVEVHVLDGVQNYQPIPITLEDGETQAKVDLTTLDNAYCVVAKPFSESSLVPGHCALTLDRTTRSVQGNWDLLLGLQGQVSEIKASQRVTVEAERLSTGYVMDADNGKLHLYCNILHTVKNVTFCRFQRTSNAFGYNMVDGLSDGNRSYYGNGFALKQCGMTIESPTASDYGTWRCSVGVGALVGNRVVQDTPMQALISVPASSKSFKMERDEQPERAPRTVFVQEHTEFTMTCRADVSLSYCWFQHPNGTQFTPVKRAFENKQEFWYAGESLDTGDCGVTFSSANSSDAGLWICHMGPKNNIGLEVTGQVELRVTGPLAANKKDIPATVGGPATVYCHASNGNRPLAYCRFLSPTYMGFNIDSSVTDKNAILERFYFTPGRDLSHGDCSLSITQVQLEDVGTWTCAAVVDNGSEESRDTAVLYIDSSSAPRFRAGIVGASVGLSVLVLVALAYAAHRRGWIHVIRHLRRNTTSGVSASSCPTDTFSLPLDARSIPTRASFQSSISSGSSVEQEIRSN